MKNGFTRRREGDLDCSVVACDFKQWASGDGSREFGRAEYSDPGADPNSEASPS
jgi:hypothetical protein